MPADSPLSREDNRTPPGPKNPGEFKAIFDGRRSPLEILQRLLDQFGDVVRYATRSNTYTLINDSKLIREVLANHNFVRSPLLKTILGNGLLSADGPHWERQRRLMLPEFRPARIEGLVDLFREVAVESSRDWLSSPIGPETIDLNRAMDRIALTNICRSLFGTNIDDSFLDAFAVVMRELGEFGNSAAFSLPLTRTPHSNRNFTVAMGVVEDAVRKIVNDSNPSGGFLKSLQQADREIPLSPRELRDEIVTMITAGHETTAVSLSWFWHVLMSHPGVEEAFYREIDEVLVGRPVTSADIPRLVTTRRIIDETLRLYPPIWIVARIAVRQARVGEFDIPANSAVLVSPFTLHRRADYWPDPEKFDMDRFSGQVARDDGSYIPFLSGRHLCIGKHFALTELTVVVATLAQRFRFRRTDDAPIQFQPTGSLRMRDPLVVQASSREIPRGRA